LTKSKEIYIILNQQNGVLNWVPFRGCWPFTPYAHVIWKIDNWPDMLTTKDMITR